MSGEQILLVDDEPDILEFLSYNLAKEGFEITVAGNGNEALKKADEQSFDLIILDVMMPHMDGIEACEKLRAMPNQADALIIFLTARAEDYSQIAGLDAGADDYVSKPIKPRVLMSRIKALLRRKNRPGKQAAKTNDQVFHIDRDRYVISKGDREFNLPKKEFELAALLIAKPGKVFVRDVILSSIWGEDVVVGDRTIDVHIRKLREKLGAPYFVTVKGVGYKFVNDPAA